MSDFKTRFRELLRVRGLDDNAVARAANMSREAVNRIVNHGDFARVRPGNIRRLADAVGLTPGELVALSLPASTPATTMQSGMSLLHIFSVFDALPAEDQTMLLRELANRAARSRGRSAAAIYEELAAAAVRELTLMPATKPQTPVRGRGDRKAG
jgi:hypothetical protein